MNVLFVASECAPFVKTGGLADVVSALPKALGRADVAVRVLLPCYPALRRLADTGEELLRMKEAILGEFRIVAAEAEGLSLLLLDAPRLFDRPGNPYLGADGRDWPDNHMRFSALSKVAARIGRDGIAGWAPAILHAHDWQAGLAPAYLRLGGSSAVGTVTTIHNVAFQGLFPQAALRELELPPAEMRVEGFEYHGNVSFLKAGLVWADRITTVSPTYARELTSPEFGMGFDGILSALGDRLTGILNGVDMDVWNPETDPALPATYTARTLVRRKTNRRALIERFGLSIADDRPLFCVVSRLTRQKGLDLLLEALPTLIARGAGLIVLGTGDTDLEAGFRAAARAMPTQVGLQIGYDEPLSHLMQGGADSILVPSRFEPCGLTQLYGLRYGCLPLVARTGGLADTVIDANEAAMAASVATGFQFAPITTKALAEAIGRACDLSADPKAWQATMRRAMRHPVGWDRSADGYRALYSEIRDALPRRGGAPGKQARSGPSARDRRE